jgi:HEAT repeat protein
MAESQEKGEAFELHVKALLEQHDFQVERDVLIAGNQVDLVARRSVGPVPEVFVIECKAYADPVGANDVNVFIGEVTAAQREEDPRVRGIIVSTSGFTRNAKRSAAAAGVTCLTVTELEQGLPPELDFEAAVARYNKHVVDRHGRLTLYSLTADAPLSVELEKVYVRLTAVRPVDQELPLEKIEEVLKALSPSEARILRLRLGLTVNGHRYSPGELALRFGFTPQRVRQIEKQSLDKVQQALDRKKTKLEAAVRQALLVQTLSMQEALTKVPRLIIIGAPGSGKTTLLQWVALTFARGLSCERIGLEEHRVPILVPLRVFGKFIESHTDRFEPTPACLLDFLEAHFDGWHLGLPQRFFARLADEGRCVFLFDGLDEVADPGRRADVARAVQMFVARYGGNRYVVTSRPAGYTGLARFGADFRRCDIRPFTDEDVESFVTNWYLAVETVVEDNPAARQKAEDNTADLLQRIRENDRIRRLVDTPLLLTVVALVHQNRTTLPERRAELYDECTQMLLGFWDEQKGGEAARELARLGELDRYEKRAIMEPVALRLHEQREAQEVEGKNLRKWLQEEFALLGTLQPDRQAELFLRVIQERAGLLVESEPDTYRFSHLTFQEYLAARAVADRDDYVEYTLARRHDSWWREVILLEVGHLSTPRSRRARRLTTDLVQAIWTAEEEDPLEQEVEKILRRNLLLAGHCLADLGSIGVEDAVRDGIVAELGRTLHTTPYSELREEAVQVLAGLGGSGSAAQAAAELIQALADDNPDVRRTAASGLGQLGQASPEILHALIVTHTDDRLWWVREEAANSLSQLGRASPDAVQAVITAFTDDDLDAPGATTPSLGTLGKVGSGTVQPFIIALTDHNSDTREVAASGLGQLGQASPDVVQALIVALTDDDSRQVRRAAVSSLGRLGQTSPKVVQALITALTDVDQQVRQTAVSSLGQLAQISPEVLQALIAALASTGSLRFSQAAASSASQLGQTSPDAIQALIPALSHDDLDTRETAARGLEQMSKSSPEALQALIIDFTYEEDSRVRENIAYRLGQLGQSSSEVAQTLIVALANDASWRVRRAAATSLGQIGQASTQVITALVGALKDSGSDVRKAAANGLARLAASDREVVLHALLPTFSDPTFAAPDGIEDRPGHDYAFDALWAIAGSRGTEGS